MTEPTTLLYLADQSADTMTATVVETGTDERGAFVVTDRTVFYPQGGGQPGDTGILSIPENSSVIPANSPVIPAKAGISLNVLTTRFDSGHVLHYVDNADGLEPGLEISGTIDRTGRDTNSRAHSAGHLLDVVVEHFHPDWLPDRGHHFPGECFVSYEGAKPEDVDGFIESANAMLAELIAGDLTISDSLATLAEIREKCTYVPPNMPEDKPLRVVSIGDNTPCPCGGTHVARLADLGSVTITKIKAKKGKVKVSYRIS